MSAGAGKGKFIRFSPHHNVCFLGLRNIKRIHEILAQRHQLMQKIYQSSQFNDKNAFRKWKIFLSVFQLYTRAYVRIWTLHSSYITKRKVMVSKKLITKEKML